MESQFWRKRWTDNEIGWHQEKPNAHLVKYWPVVADGSVGTVLVPLCGKSLDMVWLAQCGYRVVGVELSEVAIESFFRENGMAPQWQEVEGCRFLSDGPYTLYCADIFHITPGLLGRVDFIYDRAAHIALPPDVRTLYGKHLGVLSSTDTKALLLTIEYEQSRRDGPPFSVLQSEIENNFGDDFEIENIFENEIIDERPKYRDWGLDSLIERGCILKARGKVS